MSHIGRDWRKFVRIAHVEMTEERLPLGQSALVITLLSLLSWGLVVFLVIGIIAL